MTQPQPVAAGPVLAEADRILGIDSGPRPLTAVRLIADSHGAARAAVTAGVGPLPTLGQVIRDAEHLGAQMIAVLGRQWDPTSGPDEDFAGVGYTDVHLMQAVAEVRSALRALGEIGDMPSLRAAGSAVKFPARQDPAVSGPVATPGEPDQAPDPSPRRADMPDGGGVRRGVGPGVLGASPRTHDPAFCGCAVCCARRSQ